MGEKLKEEWEKKILAERENKKEEKRENPEVWSLLLISAHGLPLINNLYNLCINTYNRCKTSICCIKNANIQLD